MTVHSHMCDQLPKSLRRGSRSFAFLEFLQETLFTSYLLPGPTGWGGADTTFSARVQGYVRNSACRPTTQGRHMIQAGLVKASCRLGLWFWGRGPLAPWCGETTTNEATSQKSSAKMGITEEDPIPYPDSVMRDLTLTPCLRANKFHFWLF